MAFDIEGAKSAGYSDAEIANFLGQQNNFDVASAKKAGYSDTEILGHLTAIPAVKPVAPAVTPETQNFSALRQVADVPLQVGKGLVSGVRMISDAFGANSDTGKTLRGAEDYIANLMSAQSKQDSQEVARIMKDAEDKGILDQVKAGVKAFTVAPIDLLSNAFGTAAPAIVASLGATVLGPAAALTAGLGVGATMGAGTVKGSIYDAVKEELSKTKMPADQIEARAELAQAYNGNNLDMILTGAAVGALGATTGAEPAIARQMSKGIIAKAAVKKEIKDVAEKGIEKAAERGIVKQGAITGAKEFGTESVQAGQEQGAQNIALQREGFDVPTMRGVVGQATLEGLAGLGLGTVAGGREALKAQDVLDQRKLIADQEAKLKEEQLKKEQATTPEAKAAAQQNINDILAASLNAPKEDTFDILSDEEKTAKAAKLEASIAKRQGELDAGTHPNPKAAVNTQANQIKELAALKSGAPIPAKQTVAKQAATFTDLPSYLAAVDAGHKVTQSEYRQMAKAAGITIPVGTSNVNAIAILKAKLGGQDAIQQINAPASGDGTELLGEPRGDISAEGTTGVGLGRPGVDGNQGLESAPQDGAGAQQLALDQEVIDEQALADQEAIAATAAEEAVAEEAPVEQVVEEAPVEQVVEEAPVEQVIEEAPVEAVVEEEPVEQVVEEEPVEAAVIEQPQLTFDQWRQEQGFVFSSKEDYEAALPALQAQYQQEMSRATPVAAAPTKTAKVKKTKTPKVTPEATLTTTTPENRQKIDSFDQLADLVQGKMHLAEGKGDAQITSEPSKGKKTKKIKTLINWFYRGKETAEASVFNFLHKNGVFSDGAPYTMRKGIITGSLDEAYDLFDSVDIFGKIEPEIKRILVERMTKRNAEIEEQRVAMKKQMKENGFSEKDIKASLGPLKKVKYVETDPLKFMSKIELIDLFEDNIGTKSKGTFTKVGGEARVKLQKDRRQFIESLNKTQKDTFMLLTNATFDLEVLNFAYKGGTASNDKRLEANNNQKTKLEKRIKEKQEELGVEELTNDQLDAVELSVAEEFAVEAEQQELEEAEVLKKALEKDVKKAPAVTEKKEPSKPGLIVDVENSINNNDPLSAVKDIADKKGNSSATRSNANAFLKLVKNFGKRAISYVVTDINRVPEGALEIGQVLTEAEYNSRKEEYGDNSFNAEQKDMTLKIGFSEELGPNEDGVFNPETNGILIKGKDGVYTGDRPLDQAVMHEVGHYLVDHVIDNREEYINSLPKAEQRAEVRAALNRLDNNYRFVNSKLGDKFNISSMKEFIAELFSNPQFQIAVANLDSGERGYDWSQLKELPGPIKTYKPNRFTLIVDAIAKALGLGGKNEAATYKESLEDILTIVSLPTANLRGKEISYAAALPKAPKQAPFLEVKSVYDSNPAFAVPDKLQKNRFVSVIKDIFTHQGIQNIIKKYQNDRQAVKFLENQNIRAGTNKDYGPGVNNAYTQITLAPVKAMNKFYDQIQAKQDKLIQDIVAYSKTKEIKEGAKKADKEKKTKEGSSAQTVTPMLFAEQVLGIYGQAFTDLERRLNMFVQTSPFDNVNKNVPIGNTMVTAADARDLVLGNPKMGKAGILDTNQNLTEDQARQAWEFLESLAFVTDANGNKAPNPKYVVPGGYSPEGRTALDFRNIEGSTAYNVTGFTYDETNKLLKEYDNDPHKDLLDKILNTTWDLNKVALGLNKESYYVSKPAANWIAAYGYEHYVPLKGIVNHTEAQQRGAYNFNGNKEKDLVDTAIKSEGRFSVSNNPILQTMSEAMISAMRAGKGPEYTLSIKNLLGKGINGRVVKTVPFNEKTFDNIKNLRKENTVFHHNEDGSIDVIEINDNNMLNSIRRTYKDENRFIEMANLITSGLGQVHTRYNVNFGPLNFVRDALTNAWNIGATLGPVKGAELITRMAVQIATRNSLGKAFQVARAYKTPNFEKFKNSTDPIYRNMYELIKEGGMVEYLEGISLKSNLEKLNKEVGRSRIIKTKEGIDSIVDVWTSMFEIASRAAAYGVLKEHYMKEMNLDEKAAKIRAASTTKNLANFEQVGEYGKIMGALYMFYRPSATGAVRAIESITPMLWRSLERAERNMPDHIKNDPAAKATYMNNYKKERRNAQLMTTVLAAAGALAYTMSYLMADTDDQDRNKVLTDDMGQWTRFWRIHIPGYDKPFQIPWGFGLGAFAAMGAQLAAAVTGQQSFGSALKNGVTQIALDSFVPIPFSRMDATEMPGAWFVDSLSPSFMRPVVEFVMNKNGLGQSIYNDANGRRMGDAYLGGDHVPETYKIFTKWLAETSDGYFDLSPNAAYFLVNSYADGPARLIDLMVNNYYLANGSKEYNAKTDVPFIGSFIGAAPNIDTREFTKVEKQINEIRANVNQFKTFSPEYYYSNYVPNHPFDEAIIELYDKSISDLNELRAQDKLFRGPDNTMQARKELLDMNRMQQNLIKHNLVKMFEAYDIKP